VSAAHPGRAGTAQALAPFVPRLALDWLQESPEAVHRRLEGTLLFVDVSGFTALTERLAARGKVGAEEITDVIGSVFGELLGIATSYGADLLKWGGDAVLLFFREPSSAPRACRAAALMSRAMARIGNFRTSSGRVTLGVSIGGHSGEFDFYLLGDEHRELVVTGPAASITARMEQVAESGEVVVSPGTARRLEKGTLGAVKLDGVMLAHAPDGETVPARPPPDVTVLDVASLLAATPAPTFLAGERSPSTGRRPSPSSSFQASTPSPWALGPRPWLLVLALSSARRRRQRRAGGSASTPPTSGETAARSSSLVECPCFEATTPSALFAPCTTSWSFTRRPRPSGCAWA